MENTKAILEKDIEELPKNVGIYFFYEKKEIIYIGKAINIKERVKNHFQGKNWWEQTLLRQGFGGRIGFIKTNSEIEALILEAILIKKYQPKFNQVWRDDKNYFYVAITKDRKPIVSITHQKNRAKTNYIGPFVEGASLKKTLKFLRKVFAYYTAIKHPDHACTWCHLELCPGPNPDLPEYKKNIKKLSLILQGKRKTVLKSLIRQMQELSKKHKFEEALAIRDKISALEQVMSHAKVIENSQKDTSTSDDFWQKTQIILQKILQIKSSVKKIECYDISNIQGTQAVGSMVVFVNGKPDKNQYKKFRIRMGNKPNDIAMLKEVLMRRLAHPEWDYPEIMLIDGGIAQLNIGITTKNQYSVFSKALKNTLYVKNIKIISIAKGRQELFIEGQKKPIPLQNLPQEIYNIIVHLDDEAHRFAITYHKKIRKRELFKI